jgi:hypothetical protein
MDTGDGRMVQFDAPDPSEKLKEYQKAVEDMQKLYPGHGGIFKVGEEVELKGSRFTISKILNNGLKLKLTEKE